MISTRGGVRAGMGIGSGGLSTAGEAYLWGMPRLLKFLGGKRNTHKLGPGSFPGYNPDGTPMDGEDPYQYANFNTQPQQASAPGVWDRIKGGLPNPWPGAGSGGGGGGNTQKTGGGIGSQIWKGLNSDFGQTALGAGVGLIGAKMQSNQMNKANEINQKNSDRSYEMAMEEKRRRDLLTKMLMPQLVRDMGVNNPETAQRLIGGF